jgi:hypothetical protein
MPREFHGAVYALNPNALVLDHSEWIALRARVVDAYHLAGSEDASVLTEVRHTMECASSAGRYLLCPLFVQTLRRLNLLPCPEGNRHGS